VFTVGETVFYTGPGQTLRLGYTLVYGQQGKVAYSGLDRDREGHMGVFFPGNTGSIEWSQEIAASKVAPPPLQPPAVT
tara:strand:+ start:572 stop:805 length:234 start_codon:yes stop_codon:yes gene_type:complete